MNVELDKKGLLYLVNGIVPHSDSENHWIVKNRGAMNVNDIWAWDFDILQKLNEQELYDIYEFCRDSWKKENK